MTNKNHNRHILKDIDKRLTSRLISCPQFESLVFSRKFKPT